MHLDPTLGIAVFTDGSANYKDRSGGWGWVALDAFSGVHTSSGHWCDTTISQMELYAVTNALRGIHEGLGSVEALVYSDSEYVVLGCQEPTRKRNKNKNWWWALDLAIELHQHVEFDHVRGHSDHLYNEMADKLAGEARKEGLAK